MNKKIYKIYTRDRSIKLAHRRHWCKNRDRNGRKIVEAKECLLTGSTWGRNFKWFRNMEFGMARTRRVLYGRRTIGHASSESLESALAWLWSYFAFGATRSRPNAKLTIAASTWTLTSCCNLVMPIFVIPKTNYRRKQVTTFTETTHNNIAHASKW